LLQSGRMTVTGMEGNEPLVQERVRWTSPRRFIRGGRFWAFTD